MPIIKNDYEITTIFILNHVIARFKLSKQIVTDHGTHFENDMMKELAVKLGFIMTSPHLIILNLMDRLRQSIKSLRLCCKGQSINIEPIDMLFFFQHYGLT